MESPKFLIACHCFDHYELFLTNRGEEPISLKSDTLRENVEYIDISTCPGTTHAWDKIPASSKDYVVLVGCAIGQAGVGSVLHASLIMSSYRVLKPGGKILMTNVTKFLEKLPPEPIIPALFDTITYPIAESPIRVDTGPNMKPSPFTRVVVIHTKKELSKDVEGVISGRVASLCSLVITTALPTHPDKIAVWEKFLTFSMLFIPRYGKDYLKPGGKRNNHITRRNNKTRKVIR